MAQCKLERYHSRVEKWLSRLFAIAGAVFVLAVQTGPDQAFENLGNWLGAISAAGVKAWVTIAGTILLGAAALLALHRRGLLRLRNAQAIESASQPKFSTNPLITQIDGMIDRLEQANKVYASDPDGFFRLPKYAKFRMQVAEMDQVGEAVRLAIERKFGAESKEEQLAEKAMKEEIKPYMASDDDFFRANINWLMRLRNVATLLT